MKSQKIFILFELISILIVSSYSNLILKSSVSLPLNSIAQQLANNVNSIHYSMATS